MDKKRLIVQRLKPFDQSRPKRQPLTYYSLAVHMLVCVQLRVKSNNIAYMLYMRTGTALRNMNLGWSRFEIGHRYTLFMLGALCETILNCNIECKH